MGLCNTYIKKENKKEEEKEEKEDEIVVIILGKGDWEEWRMYLLYERILRTTTTEV